MAQQKRAEEARRTVIHRQFASRGTPANFTRRSQPGNMNAVIERYRDAVLYFNHRLHAWEAERIARSIIAYSNRYGLDARLVMAVIACESNFNPNAVSRVGARGLGQLMPGTAAGLGVGDAFNEEENLDGATRLLRNHLDHMSGGNGHAPSIHEIQLALACYNAWRWRRPQVQGHSALPRDAELREADHPPLSPVLRPLAGAPPSMTGLAVRQAA